MNRFIFSHNLRILREESGLTQSKISQMLFISRQTYSNYENALREPSLTLVIEIAKLLHVSLDTLLLGSDLSCHSNHAYASLDNKGSSF